MANRDYYEVLGVPKGSSEADIKKAYRRLAKQFHPDHNKGDQQSEARFKEVQEAYAVLSDKEKRARYDQFGHAGVDPRFQPGGATHWSTRDGEVFDFDSIADMFDFSGGRRGGGVSSVLEEFLRKAGGRDGVHVDMAGHDGGRSGFTAEAPHSSRDLEHPVTLSFEQALHGTTLNLQLQQGRSSETIAVRIPPGVRNGQRIRVRGKGQPGGGRKPAGDLYVVCHVQPHRYWERCDDHLYLMAPVTIAEAALGARIDVPTPDGVRTVTLPPGTASGAKLRLAGLGMPNPRGSGRGDFFVVIKIVPPNTLTDEQRRLLEQLARTQIGSPRDGLWS